MRAVSTNQQPLELDRLLFVSIQLVLDRLSNGSYLTLLTSLGPRQQGIVLRCLTSCAATALKHKWSAFFVPMIVELIRRVYDGAPRGKDPASETSLAAVRQVVSALLLPRLGAAAVLEDALDDRNFGPTLIMFADSFRAHSNCWLGLRLFSSLPTRAILLAAAADLASPGHPDVSNGIMHFFRAWTSSIALCSVWLLLLADVERGPAAAFSFSHAESLYTLCASVNLLLLVSLLPACSSSVCLILSVVRRLRSTAVASRPKPSSVPHSVALLLPRTSSQVTFSIGSGGLLLLMRQL